MTGWRLRATGLAFILGVVTGAASLSAQVANPHEGDRGAIRAGGALFATRCAECHGADARGISGPDLTVLWGVEISDERVFRTLRRGIPGSIMPSSDAPDDELWAIVAYLKSIGTVAREDNLVGDAVHGREVFRARCARCHRVGGEGGSLGPDLSLIGQTRSREALVQAIRDPGASIAVGYRPVTLTDTAGQRVQGTIKGEDAFSIQVLDTQGRLQGYLKSDLRELSHDGLSLMPRFGPAELDVGDLDDVVKYLSTLRQPEVGI